MSFRCSNYSELFFALKNSSYAQVKLGQETAVKINFNKNKTDWLWDFFFLQGSKDFDYFYVFVPPWLSKDKEQVDSLLGLICSQSNSREEIKNSTQPPFIIFIPKTDLHRRMSDWNGAVLYIEMTDMRKLALNSTEFPSSHLVVNRYDHCFTVEKIFLDHLGSKIVQLERRLPRHQNISSTFNDLKVNSIFSSTLTKWFRIWLEKWFVSALLNFPDKHRRYSGVRSFDESTLHP